MSTTPRERSASSKRLMTDLTSGSLDGSDAATAASLSAAASAARRRSASRLASAYRLTDPISDPIYSTDYWLRKPLPSIYGNRWTLSHEEMLRQLNDERLKVKELELIRNQNTATITDLESQIRAMRINGYDDAAGIVDENVRLRRQVATLQDEVIQLRAGRDYPHSLELANRLDVAETRVRVLEQQIVNDAAVWQAERAQLLNELAQFDRHWLPHYTTVLPPAIPPRYVVYRD